MTDLAAPAGALEPSAALTPAAADAGGLARAVPPLLHGALSALDADLGAKCVGWTTDADGKRVRVYRRRMELLAEALEPDTLQVVIRWLSSSRRTSVSTRRCYADDLLSVWVPLARQAGYDRFALGQLTTAHLELWFGCVTDTDPDTGRPELSARSIRRYTASLSSLYSYASRAMDPPPRNPVSEDVTPKIDEQDASTATRILEKDEVRAVAEQATRLRDQVLISLLYILAGRVTEICQADAQDVHVHGEGPFGRTFLRVTRKGNEPRDLEIPRAQAKLIDRYLDGRASGPLLLNSQGQRLDRSGALWISASLGRAAGVLNGDALTPHVWRASRITHMLDALYEQNGQQGVMAGLAQVMIFANHKRPETTLRYWIRRDHAARNAELARTGEQVLEQVIGDWLGDDGSNT
ncbi:tyrosine-type recombinase/integrase [Actinomadura coerulea]|uniref:tyrosine-type recombinase/integrase n=1 Tax=Actinomadura coerulea TaxID=46159 RepID=UPI00343BDF16